MSPKRRYQKSSISIGLGTTTTPSTSTTALPTQQPGQSQPQAQPTQPHPPPTTQIHPPPTQTQSHPQPEVCYGGPPHTSYAQPITPAEIKVNPCITYRKLGSRQPPQRDVEGSSHSPTRYQPSAKLSSTAMPTSTNKGSRTYRVRHHHQNHYDIPVAPISPPGTALGHHASSGSLSQGIFGLPVIHDYLRNYQQQECDFEELGGHKLMEPSHEAFHSGTTKYTDTRPRMKSTLPSFRPSTPTSSGIPDDIEGVLQVRPASRSRTRPEQSGSHQALASNHKKGARRRVQSSGSSHHAAAHAHHAHTPHATGSAHAHLSHPSHSHTHVPRSSTVPQDSDAYDTSDEVVVDSMIHDALNNLKSSDWEEICDAFHKIQHLTTKYPPLVNGVLKRIIWSGLPHVASSRTKVSRSACQCFKKLFETQKRSMEGEGDKVFQRLLDLSGGPHNKFIQDECKEALLAAVQNTDALKCTSLIEQYGAKHRNANVREFSAQLLAIIMERLPIQKIMSREYAQKIFPLIIGFLREGQLNTRLSAKECLGKIVDHPEFETKLRKYVSPENIRHVNDTIRKFRVRRTS